MKNDYPIRDINWLREGKYVTYLQVATSIGTTASYLAYGDSYVHDLIREMKRARAINLEYQIANSAKRQQVRTVYISPEFAQKIRDYREGKRRKRGLKQESTGVASLRQTESREATDYFDNLFKPAKGKREFFVAVKPE